jgi:hypothetical protein
MREIIAVPSGESILHANSALRVGDDRIIENFDTHGSMTLNANQMGAPPD